MQRLHLLCLCVISVLLSVSVLAQDQSGFISIDCGIPNGSSYIDEATGLNYISDTSFVQTGESKSVSDEHMSKTLPRQVHNLRSFPEGSRNCLTLKPTQGKGHKYIVRAIFMYGNYDGEDAPPKFDLYMGGNRWDTVSMENASAVVTKEIVYLNPYEEMYVCVGNKGEGTPLMSALEVRFLGSDNTTYDSPNGALFFSRRWDLGSKAQSVVRYKDDMYDRIWISRILNFCRSINTSVPLRSNNSYSPSPVVMSSAMTPIDPTQSITLEFQMAEPNVKYFVYMHFAEITKLKSNETREFNVALHGKNVIDAFSPKYLRTNTLVLTPESQSTIKFTLDRTERSTLPPIINAIEIYTASSFLQSQTSQEEADAIVDVKNNYKVKKNWQGDPCTPQEYTWEGVSCTYDSYNPPRITSL